MDIEIPKEKLLEWLKYNSAIEVVEELAKHGITYEQIKSWIK